MSQFSRVALAAALSTLAFVATGGIHATAQAVRAEEAASPSSGRAPDVAIPFVNHGGVRDWRADGDTKLYIQDSSGKWYLATLAAPSPDLPFATAVGFETRGSDRLDKFGSVVISGKTYPLAALAESGPPPPRQRR